MKIIEKITLIIYSNIMLILSIIICLLVFGWLDTNVVTNLLKNFVTTEPGAKIALGISILFILLSIRCIFFDPTSKAEIRDKQGILLENENGKLMISKETIENLVETVAREFKEAQEITTRVELDKENNVSIFANLVVSSETIIKELSIELQNEIKERVKKVTDLEVKEVNISVKKVAPIQQEQQI